MWAYNKNASDPLEYKIKEGDWTTIRLGHELVPINNSYMIDWVPGSGDYRLWRYDRYASDPLPGPALQAGTWLTILAGHVLVPAIAN